MPRPSIPTGFAIGLPPGDSPKSTRLALEIIRLVSEGRLEDGDRLPSTRALAATVGVSRSVAVAAYEELATAGYIRAKHGAMTVVDTSPSAAPSDAKGRLRVDLGDKPSHRETASSRIVHDLIPGAPDGRLIDARAWDTAWRQAYRTARRAEPEHYDRPGAEPDSETALRAQLSRHLRSHRGIVCEPEDIWIFSGLNSALATIVGVLGLESRPVAFEDPGNVCARRVLEASGCTITPCPVDSDGLVTDELTVRESAVYTSPSHQHPLGVAMSPTRRKALLEWSERTGGVVLEDDHDSQFRHRPSLLGPLRSADGAENSVILLMSGNRLLSHQLKLTWAVVPQRFRSLFRQYFASVDYTPCPVTSAAVGNFLESGAFTLHIARAGRTYTERGERFGTACRDRLDGGEATGHESGMHALIELEEGVRDLALVDDLKHHGLSCLPLSSFYASSTGARRRSGLVCGFGRLALPDIEPAVIAIADGVARARGVALTANRSGLFDRRGSGGC